MPLWQAIKSFHGLLDDERQGRALNKKFFEKDYVLKGVTAFLVIAASILFYFLMLRFDRISAFIGKAVSVLSPIIYGLVIAYLLNPVAKFLYNRLLKLFKKRIRNEKTANTLANGFSVAISILLFLLIIVALVALVIPQFITSISSVIDTLPKKIDSLIALSEDYMRSNKKLESIVAAVLKYGKKWLETDLANFGTNLAAQFAAGILNAVNFIKDLVIGIICAIYLLLWRKKYIARVKKLFASIFKKEHLDKMTYMSRHTLSVFGGFINGKLIDSLIIGVLCFIGVTVLRIPYPMLVSVIVGVTNIIPVFGPYIGAIPCAVLVLLTEPIKCLYFIIFIILLQTLDGNLLGPKILGDRTGLDTFFVVFAIVVGGGLFGILGMLLGVPLFAVVYYALGLLVNKKLEKKGLPTSSEYYLSEETVTDNAKEKTDKSE